MTTQITSYINFNGNTREAMTFYKECLGGELTLQTVEETPMAAQCPDGMQRQVMHAMLTKGELLLMASDMMGREGYIAGNNMSLCINCSTQEEINTFFTKLAEDGKIIEPLKTQFWGAIFGVLTDKFGIRWLLNYQKDLQ